MKIRKITGPFDIKVELHKCLCGEEELILKMKVLLNEVITAVNISEEWKTIRTVLLERSQSRKQMN